VFTIALRFPAWSRAAELKIEGQTYDYMNKAKNGYIYITCELGNNEVTLEPQLKRDAGLDEVGY
jgi:DUF1680 family protein